MATINWPEGKESAASFTFDVDAESAWLAMDPANAARPGVLSQAIYGPRVGVPLLLEVLAKHDVKGSFFIPGVNVELYPETVQSIIEAGHELGLHGYTHTPPARLSREEESDELDKAYDLLTGAGATVTGYRSPSWDVSPHTLDLLEAKGLVYASQFMDDFRPYRHPGRRLVELPVQWILDDWPHFAWYAGDSARTIRSTVEVEVIWKEEFDGMRDSRRELHPDDASAGERPPLTRRATRPDDRVRRVARRRLDHHLCRDRGACGRTAPTRGSSVSANGARRALVTGAARGLGEGVVGRLARDGWSVLLFDQSADVTETAARIASEQGLPEGRLLALTGSVADEEAVDAAVGTAVERFGGLELVVANAGVGGAEVDLIDLEPAEFDRIVSVNLRGVYLTSRAGGRVLREARTRLDRHDQLHLRLGGLPACGRLFSDEGGRHRPDSFPLARACAVRGARTASRPATWRPRCSGRGCAREQRMQESPSKRKSRESASSCRSAATGQATRSGPPSRSSRRTTLPTSPAPRSA